MHEMAVSKERVTDKRPMDENRTPDAVSYKIRSPDERAPSEGRVTHDGMSSEGRATHDGMSSEGRATTKPATTVKPATTEATMTAGKTGMATSEATMTTAAMTKRHGKRGQQYNC